MGDGKRGWISHCPFAIGQNDPTPPSITLRTACKATSPTVQLLDKQPAAMYEVVVINVN
jgi:hypothetical protein